jgi:hypothetical protein
MKFPGCKTETKPGKHSDTRPGKHSDNRTNPLALALDLANGHGSYTTADPERTRLPVGECEWPLHNLAIKCLTVSLPKRSRGGCLNSRTPPPGSRSGLRCPLKILETPTVDIIVFSGGGDGWFTAIEICLRTPGGLP